MLHLLYLVGTMAYTNTTHSWSAPLLFRLFASLFLRPPWNGEATERLAPDNQLQRGWKTQFISALFLEKQPLEQEMTVDVLIFKRWAPRSLRLDGRSRSNVTELPSLSEQPAQNNRWEAFFFFCLGVEKWSKINVDLTKHVYESFVDILGLWSGNCRLCCYGFRAWEKRANIQRRPVKGTFVSQILTEIYSLYQRLCLGHAY